MDDADALDYCLAKPGAWEDQPWEDSVVVKVGSRIAMFTGQASGRGIGVKCGANRDEADEWLVRFPDDARVMPYLGRSGWNTLLVGGAIPDDEIREAIDASYAYVVSRLPRRERPDTVG